MTTEGSAVGQVFVDMKTSITTCGPHNGIIVQCGIYQGPNTSFWPFTPNDASTSLASQQFVATPTPTTIQWPQTPDETVGDGGDNRDNTPFDNVFESEKVRLNVFQTDPVVVEPSSSGTETVLYPETRYKPHPGSATFKTPSDRVPSIRRSLATVRNIDDHGHSSVANVNTNVKVAAPNENTRLKPVMFARTDGQCVSSTQMNSSFTPVEESCKIETRNYELYSDTNDKAANYKYHQIEKEFMEIHPLGKKPIKIADSGMTYGSREDFTANLNRIAQYGSSEQIDSTAYHWNQQQQRYKSTPDLRQMQSPLTYSIHPKFVGDVGIQKVDNQREVPELMYHLYQTQDAFGNLLAQCKKEIETDEQVPQRLSSPNVSDKHPSLDVEENRNLVENLGLLLIPDRFSTEVNLTEGNLPNHFQILSKYSQAFSDISYDVDTLRRTCNSLYGRSIIPISSSSQHPKKVCEGFVHLPSCRDSACRIKKPHVVLIDEISGNKSDPERNAVEYSKFLAKTTSASSEQVEKVVARNPFDKQLAGKAENFEKAAQEIRNRGKDVGKDIESERVGSARSIRSNPTKSILHMSARRNSLRKKVRFPAEQRPKVIAVEHRLLIGDLDLV